MDSRKSPKDFTPVSLVNLTDILLPDSGKNNTNNIELQFATSDDAKNHFGCAKKFNLLKNSELKGNSIYIKPPNIWDEVLKLFPLELFAHSTHFLSVKYLTYAHKRSKGYTSHNKTDKIGAAIKMFFNLMISTRFYYFTNKELTALVETDVFEHPKKLANLWLEQTKQSRIKENFIKFLHELRMSKQPFPKKTNDEKTLCSTLHIDKLMTTNSQRFLSSTHQHLSWSEDSSDLKKESNVSPDDKPLLCEDKDLTTLISPVPSPLYMEKKEITFIQKLESAMAYAQHVAVLHSSNKFNDIVATALWSCMQSYRYNTRGHYYRYEKKADFLENDCDSNATLDLTTYTIQTKKIINNWYYRTLDHSNINNIEIQLTPRNAKLDPLEDSQFQIRKDVSSVLGQSMFVLKTRQTNCGGCAKLVSKYLWEHPNGIYRIEGVKMRTFDHVLVIVNRKGNSKNPATWGNAWIIDAWYKNGIIFPAIEFSQRIKQIKAFAEDQALKFERVFGWKRKKFPAGEDFGEVKWEIRPGYDRYPTYSNRPIEDYYNVVDNGFVPKDEDKKLHQLKFHKCLEEIKMSTNELRTFFANIKSKHINTSIKTPKSNRISLKKN